MNNFVWVNKLLMFYEFVMFMLLCENRDAGSKCFCLVVVVGGGRHGRMRGGRLVDSCVKFQILEDE